MYVASTVRRTVAHIMDEAIGALFWLPLFVLVWTKAMRGEDLLVHWKWILGIWIARMTYEVLCIYALQALPGQYFLGLKILSTHRPELGLGLSQVFIRVLMSQLKYILGPSIYFMALFHRERQHLGDVIAETHVVQYSERFFKPRMRFVLGSILVYFSLINNLSYARDFILEERVTRNGVVLRLPTMNEIEIKEW